MRKLDAPYDRKPMCSASPTRLVKIFMRLPDGNISTAHLSVPYNGLICQHDSLLVQRFEVTVLCLYPDDFDVLLMPSVFILDANVVGLMPRSSAAPSTPEILPLVSLSAATMLARSRANRSVSL